MVLYNSSEKGCKLKKSNWKMHQLHLGTEEHEKGGEFVVSKIFYDIKGETSAAEDLSSSPKTPKTNAPSLIVGKASPSEDLDNSFTLGDYEGCNKWLAGESQAYEDHEFQRAEDSLLCKEILDPHPNINNQSLNQIDYSSSRKDAELTGPCSAPCGLSDLAKLEFDSPPDFPHYVIISFYHERVPQLHSTSHRNSKRSLQV